MGICVIVLFLFFSQRVTEWVLLCWYEILSRSVTTRDSPLFFERARGFNPLKYQDNFIKYFLLVVTRCEKHGRLVLALKDGLAGCLPTALICFRTKTVFFLFFLWSLDPLWLMWVDRSVKLVENIRSSYRWLKKAVCFLVEWSSLKRCSCNNNSIRVRWYF